MPCKIDTITYIHDYKEQPLKDSFIVNAIGYCKTKFQEEDYMIHIVAFYPLDSLVECNVGRFNKDQFVKISGKCTIDEKNAEDGVKFKYFKVIIIIIIIKKNYSQHLNYCHNPYYYK
jgi:hypothetical protein